MNIKLKKALTSSIIIASSVIMATSSFAASLTPMEQNDKFGFKDSSDKVVVSAQYDGYGHETAGMRPVLKNKKWGYVDGKGSESIKPIYEGITNFKDGFAPAIKNGKWGMLNKSGNEVIQFKYDKLYYFDTQGNANAKLGSKWGKVNKSGTTTVPFIYDKSDVETKATPSISNFILNKNKANLAVYTVDENNYVKLRDIAQMLKGTEKELEIKWNNQSNSIDIIQGQSYTSVGGELEGNASKQNNLSFNASKITMNGKNVNLKAYNINNNNYFKLRDIAEEIDIDVQWNNKTKNVEIDTSKRYTPEDGILKVDVTPSASDYYVNGKLVKPNAFTIESNNYAKLRDVAQLLKGTDKEFEVKWSRANNSIDLIKGTPYTSVGGELIKGNVDISSLRHTELDIYQKGKKLNFRGYNMSNNNYFKLRDISENLDISIEWNPKNGNIEIDTSKEYVPE